MFEKKEIPVIIGLNQKMRFCLYLSLGLGVVHAESLSAALVRACPKRYVPIRAPGS
jgi:hypothetical protein